MKKGTPKKTASPRKRPATMDLPDQLKAGIENLFGMSMDNVSVHSNSDMPANLQAGKFAEGSDIHLAPCQHAHLPHPNWHVVQQTKGRVHPTKKKSDKK